MLKIKIISILAACLSATGIGLVPAVSASTNPATQESSSVKAIDSANTIKDPAWFKKAKNDGIGLYILHTTKWGTCEPWAQAESQIKSALDAGMQVAAYTRDLTCWENGIKAAGKYKDQLEFFALDVETDPGKPVTREIIDGVKKTGVRPVIYTGSGMWGQVQKATANSFFDVPLWDTNTTKINYDSWKADINAPKPVTYGGWNTATNKRIGIQQKFEYNLNGVRVDLNSFDKSFLTVGKNAPKSPSATPSPTATTPPAQPVPTATASPKPTTPPVPTQPATVPTQTTQTTQPTQPASSTPVANPAPVVSSPPATGVQGRQYPLHTNIIATTFWVGELFNASLADGSQVCSTYDSNWAYTWSGINKGKVPSTADGCAGAIVGGCDGVTSGDKCLTEPRTAANDYFPTKAPTPKENPFYLDLPYDDLNDPIAFKERCTVIPWANDPGYAGNCNNGDFSYMKNRWVKMTGPNGNTCYGQIQDAGPSHGSLYHDKNYVFGTGNAQPVQGQFNNAGADVSPALNGCLGFKELDGSGDKISWSFVDAVDVPNGPWKKIVTTSGVSN
jgi:hypothetical protein